VKRVKVILVRHGEASDPGAIADGSRFLTARGRETTRAVGEKLRALALVPTQIYTSPLVRAVQTAELLALELGYAGVVIAHEPLAVGGSTARALSVLDDHGGGDVVMLVTHEPTIRALAGHLSGVGARFPAFPTSGVAVIQDRHFAGRLDPSTMSWRTDLGLDP
jgi:phosphohistidine phosphatase